MLAVCQSSGDGSDNEDDTGEGIKDHEDENEVGAPSSPDDANAHINDEQG